METKFKTEKIEKRLEFTRIIAVILVVFALVRLLLGDYSGEINWGFVGDKIDSLIFIILGIYLFITNNKKLKSISGSYLKFREEEDLIEINFKSRHNEKTSINIEKIENIEIKLKLIELHMKDNSSDIIHLDDYSLYADKKAIKEKFTMIKDKLKTMPNKK